MRKFMLRCSVCGDGLVEENPGRCKTCGKLFDSFCGDVEGELCEKCQNTMLDYLFGQKKKEARRLRRIELEELKI